MTSRAMPPGDDRIRPTSVTPLTLTLNDVPVTGTAGQTIAGVILGSGELAWRTTSAAGKPRGIFCGIGVCFDCIVTVNGERDVRACQRRASDGDTIETQHDELPEVE
ncbi:(2Fe-2S)-binding protein [Lysinibacter cavernae]|uniref:Putative molibdopterin-dependent oxidoreductase YjgC n=1 Tax=Lysinibacter cavernae TaxID=1640652 RepID=A0A7X5R3B7_9MICO|nr:(2Fe-2S)-binding protein [Lysinibacter cavernae]NIH54899.1 putative molibdopterin-dependent oxidoreductase YjgC [Lysinibacter cavernae]